MTTILLVCAAYLLLTLLMGILPGRRTSRSVAGYVAADRTMSVVVLYFVLGASVFSSFAFLGGPGWAYSRGAAAFYIIAYGVVGMVPLYFLGPRARRLGARFGFVTQAELLAHRFGSRALSVVLGVLSVVVFVPYLTLQMKGAGYILETISEGAIPLWLGALVAYAVVLVYVLASGVMGVGWTNTFQGLFMLVIAWFLGLYLPNHLYGGVGPMFEQIAESGREALLRAPGLGADGQPWSWWAFSSAVVVSAVGFSAWPHLFMKSYAAKSERALRLTVVLYPTFQLFLVPILLIGFAGVLAFPDVSPADTIVPFLLTQIDLSPVLVGLVCAGTLAASMSSGDAILHAAASIGVRDALRPLLKKGLDDRTERMCIRLLVLVVSAVAYYFAVASDVSIVALLLAAYGGVAQIFPLLFAAFYWPRATGAGALAGLLAGVGVNTLFLLAPELRPVPLHEGVYGLAANLAVFALVSRFTRPAPAETVRAYLRSGSGTPDDLPPTSSMHTLRIHEATLRLVRGDITQTKADAVVNAANNSLLGGGGVDGAIHRRGGPAILDACRALRRERYPDGLPTGEAVATTAGKLPARMVVHTVGPVWHGGEHGEADLLADAYRHSLEEARRHDLRTVAFPSISTGAYGYPVDEAALVALRTVTDVLGEEAGAFDEVRFVLFSEADLSAYARALSALGDRG